MNGDLLSTASSTWSSISAVPSATLSARLLMTSFIIGNQLFAWSGGVDDATGGVTIYNDGADYDLTTKAWAKMLNADARLGRTSPFVISTTLFGLVWSGLGKPGGGVLEFLRDGAIYVP